MKRPAKSGKIMFRVAMCALILAAGATGMLALANLKKPPAEARPEERPILVEAIEAAPVDVPVAITGYGEVRSLDVVPISPEVPGKILRIHPRLEVGEIVPKGELLFEIDPVDYRAAFDEARASVERWKQSIRLLEKKYALDRRRLGTLTRNRDLAREEFERLKTLFEEDRVGARSNVDAAERAYNLAMDQADQMAQAVELYPIQIGEAKSSLKSAEAGLALAEANLKRCEVYAPFDGRVKEVSVEQGQYVAAGGPIVTLADDSVLEIHVPIDSRDARQWLKFDENGSSTDSAWFSGLEKVRCEIRWTEDASGHRWQGTLDRVVKFDVNTRTVHLAVRVEASRALSNGQRALPLVEGMFCSVAIPGKTLRNVYELPRWAVSFENKVHVGENGRLKTRQVVVARIQGETALVTSGLSPGDLVITTRLTNPLENSLLEIREEQWPEDRS
jgi:RND family efflux transporter MFP subunit